MKMKAKVSKPYVKVLQNATLFGTMQVQFCWNPKSFDDVTISSPHKYMYKTPLIIQTWVSSIM